MYPLNPAEKITLVLLLLILFLLVGVRYLQERSHKVDLSVVRQEARP